MQSIIVIAEFREQRVYCKLRHAKDIIRVRRRHRNYFKCLFHELLLTVHLLQDTLDFVAFVAKNLQEWRACYVLECNGGQAQNLISTIGQAFVLRYNEYFNKTQ